MENKNFYFLVFYKKDQNTFISRIFAYLILFCYIPAYFALLRRKNAGKLILRRKNVGKNK
ncbi:hypothetical protein C4N15_07645 [Fusobacterium necrophorum subsp. funduliforme]|nr:hypothetical protein C4N15_07645 [Fusobacterium necrophorum subsp. funduliforme]